ncbi:NADH dehydrogenase subunit N [Pontibacter ummariensis]|uniref:NADH-quinone oxidoreductase subunit N n=1 Tax=Pontibacter ummariensis TaxID=1610492 RepID=A0A239EXX9_9BACT|nr:NADH-quinone oxidoreductase subunit N [Pontibacter ummariensis]PRY12686.1 NADH dehydrogenase subunit N [Pontibacter ummariensis]SNS49610.1 NADH dehydrogenase subunit N [Pontibacter ummariensis]
MNEQVAYLSQTIEAIVAGAGNLLPELLLATFFLLLVTLDLFRSPLIKSLLPWLALTGLFAALLIQVLGGYTFQQGFFLDLLLSDGIARYTGILFCAAGIFTLLLSLLNRSLEKLRYGHGEYYGLILVLVLGLHLMAKSVNLLMVFVAIEVVSIASYILTLTFKTEERAVEAGLKYILYGALSAGVMLYGMSFFYGLTGSLNYAVEGFGAALLQADTLLVTVAAVLVFAGFFFKIAAAPFHFWVADVYQGAPLPVVALFSTGPKIAGIVVILRFVGTFADPLFFADVQFFLGIAAIATLAIGNFTALWQKTPRRLLAFSSVSHAGFLLVGLLAFGADYTQSILFYLTVLLCMNFGIFLFLQISEEAFGVAKLDGFAGLGRAYPFIGVMAVLYLLSLTGLPPLAGFMGKLLIFSNVWEAYSLSGNNLLLVLLATGILLTAVALFYYIKIPYNLFFKRNFREENLVISLSNKLLLVLFALPLLVFFFKPDLLLNWIEQLLAQIN